MANRLGVWCCLALVVLAGCGGGSKGVEGRGASHPQNHNAHSGPSAYPGSAEANAEPRSAGATAQVTSPGALGDGSESSARPGVPSPEPPARPGLGTEWGEARTSRVHDVTFTRSDEERPFALASLFYNDRGGVEAMANHHAGNSSRELVAAGGAITVAIHDGSGESLEALHLADRTYVIGHSGERYTIFITNHTGHRFEAVGTVDGLDVINGQPGNVTNRGYVLPPFGTVEIDGFRQTQGSVAAFRFAAVGDSYAAQVGSGRNVGVIGVAFFAERGDTFDPWSDREIRRRETANPFPDSTRFARPPR